MEIGGAIFNDHGSGGWEEIVTTSLIHDEVAPVVGSWMWRGGVEVSLSFLSTISLGIWGRNGLARSGQPIGILLMCNNGIGWRAFILKTSRIKNVK